MVRTQFTFLYKTEKSLVTLDFALVVVVSYSVVIGENCTVSHLGVISLVIMKSMMFITCNRACYICNISNFVNLNKYSKIPFLSFSKI